MPKKPAKLQPAVETFSFATSSVGGVYNGRFYIDLAKAASKVNRRFYRQGRQWMVAGFTFLSSGTGAVVVSKVPITWATSNSWEKTFRAWDKQQKLAIEHSGAQSTVSAFRDFKVAINDDHATKWYNATYSLEPIDSGGVAYSAGEWQPSQIVLPGVAPTEKTLHFMGADGANSVGMILGYQKSRARVQSPAPDEQEPEDSFFSDMFDQGGEIDTVIDNATDTNDSAPYDPTNYPGGDVNGANTIIHAYSNIVDTGAAGAALGVDVAHAPGGMFPCGLIAIDWTETGDADGNANLVVQVHMVPGNYRGYLAPPMTEM